MVEQQSLTERLACPLCQGVSQIAFHAHGFPIRDCQECNHRFAGFLPASDHRDHVYGDSYFFDGGAGYPNYLKNEKLLRAHGRRLARKIARFARPGNLLDVGCAAGFVLRGFQDRGWVGQGIEPNRGMAKFAEEFCGSTVHVGSLEDDPDEEQFDLVTLIQVVAHFEDPIESLSAAIRRVRPSGHCLVETWNRDSWTARLLGSAWHEYSPPSVLHWFGFQRLIRLFSELGCEHVGGGHLTKWITGHHGKSLLESKIPETRAARLRRKAIKLIPDNLTCPYLSDDLGWLLFRKLI